MKLKGIKTMKRFLFTPYQIQYSTDDIWHEYRLSLFETFCLPSLEANKSDELYWVIFITRGTPTQHIRKLNKAIKNSKLHSNIYVNYLNYKSDLPRECEQFMSYHCEENELRIMGRLDQDDMLCKDIFDSIEHKYYESIPPSSAHVDFLCSFNNGIDYFVHNNVGVPARFESSSRGNYFVTKSHKCLPFSVSHTKAIEYAHNKNMNILQVESKKAYWGYARFPASDQGTRQKTTDRHLRRALRNKRKMCAKDVFNALGVAINWERLAHFYANFTPAPELDAYLVSAHPLEIKAKKLEAKTEIARNKWLEALDHCNIRKPLIANEMASYADRFDNLFSVLNTVYGTKLKYDETLLKITDGSSYLQFLCDDEALKNYIVLMCIKFTQKNWNTELFCAIVKYRSRGSIIDYASEKESTESTVQLRRFFKIANTRMVCKMSAGFGVGSTAEISLNYIDYSINGEGLNIVVLDEKTMMVVDTVCIDTTDNKLPLRRIK